MKLNYRMSWQISLVGMSAIFALILVFGLVANNTVGRQGAQPTSVPGALTGTQIFPTALASEAQSATATADIFNATKWAPATEAAQTEMASQLTPTPCNYCTFPIWSADVSEAQPIPDGVKAGAGVITSISYGAAGFVASNAWYQTVGSGHIVVFAGSSHRDTP